MLIFGATKMFSHQFKVNYVAQKCIEHIERHEAIITDFQNQHERGDDDPLPVWVNMKTYNLSVGSHQKYLKTLADLEIPNEVENPDDAGKIQVLLIGAVDPRTVRHYIEAHDGVVNLSEIKEVPYTEVLSDEPLLLNEQN